MKTLTVVLVFLGICAAERRFDGHSVLRLEPTRTHYHALQLLNNLDRNYASFWNYFDLHVTPESYPDIVEFLSVHNITWHVMIPNLQALVDQENAHTATRREIEGNRTWQTNPTADLSFFYNYRTNAQIKDWLNGIAAQYPTLTTLRNLGNSYKGRPIWCLKITAPNTITSKKKVIWEGGIHAREWIAPATMLYMAYKLLTTYGTDSDTTLMMEQTEFYLIPVVNPDGYDFTWTNDRMWRKTRSPNHGSPCIGTDPNRNWNNHWCQYGGSTNPCSDSYCGATSFSEVEVRTMANFVLEENQPQGRVQEFIDYHSYGQLFMAPYGWTDNPPVDAASQEGVGALSVAAIRSVNGKVFEYGRIYNIIYPASGSSADWGYDEAKVKFSYGVELRDTGTYGFLLPANQIIPQGEEIFASLKAAALYFIGGNH